MNDLKSFVISHNLNALRKKIDTGQGKLKLRLNDVDVELVVGEDFTLPPVDQNKH